jgi:hypothetical protein
MMDIDKFISENMFVVAHANGDSESVLSTDDVREFLRQQLAKPADVQILIDALREISYSHDGYARKKAEQVLAAYNKATPDNGVEK